MDNKIVPKKQAFYKMITFYAYKNVVVKQFMVKFCNITIMK